MYGVWEADSNGGAALEPQGKSGRSGAMNTLWERRKEKHVYQPSFDSTKTNILKSESSRGREIVLEIRYLVRSLKPF